MPDRLTGALSALAVTALLAAAPPPATAASALVGAVHTPAATTDPLAPLLAVVSLAAWGLAVWLLLVVGIAHAGHLPGAAGRIAAASLPRIAPVAVRRLLAPLLGITVGLAVVGAVPASAEPVPTPANSAAQPSPSALDWPTPSAALDWPAVPGMALPQPTATPATTAPVVVRPGDSLWAVAAHHLPAGATDAQIARAWPQWWSANRDAVGADPDLIHPGLSLIAPASH